MRGEHGLDLFAHPVREGALAMDRPADHRAVVGGFDELGERRDVGAGTQLARSERGGQVVRDAGADGSRSAERLGVEVGLGEVELEHRDRVGHLLGRGLWVDGEHEPVDDALEWRGGRRAVQGPDPEIDASLVGREQELALGPEALDERAADRPDSAAAAANVTRAGPTRWARASTASRIASSLIVRGRGITPWPPDARSLSDCSRASRSTAPQSGRCPSASVKP